MQVTVRFGGELATSVGRPRISLSLAKDATVADLTDRLRREYPAAQQLINTAVPIIAGSHVTPSDPLANGQEVAFLLPIAGG